MHEILENEAGEAIAHWAQSSHAAMSLHNRSQLHNYGASHSYLDGQMKDCPKNCDAQWNNDLRSNKIKIITQRLESQGKVITSSTMTTGSKNFKSLLPKVVESKLVAAGIPQDASQPQQIKCYIYLMGTIRVFNAAGTDITPKGNIRKALLGLLCTASNGARSRSYLQAMLWSDRSPEQAGASLRNALSVLRREVGDSHGELIVADNSSIALNLQAIWTDIGTLTKKQQPAMADAAHQHFDGSNRSDFLEGLDLPGQSDGEFEDWLTQERAHYARIRDESARQVEQTAKAEDAALPSVSHKRDDTHSVQPSLPDSLPTLRDKARRCIAIIPTEVFLTGTQPCFLADDILDEIAASLQILSNVDCLDLRHRDPNQSVDDANQSPELLIRLKCSIADGELKLAINAYQGNNRKRIWHNATTISVTGRGLADIQNDHNVYGFIGNNIDGLAHILSKRLSNVMPSLSPVYTLSSLFNFHNEDLRELSLMLTSAADDSDNPDQFLHRALLAYQKTFHIGEKLGGFNAAIREETIELAHKVLEHNPMNALSQAAVGHVFGYVANEHDIAGEMLEKAISLRPNLAFTWDHLALHFLYTGELEKARQASEKALLLGRYNPIRHTFEITRAMIATLEGDYKLGAFLGRKVLVRSPDFGAALRYTAICELLSGNHDHAQDLIARLCAMHPEFGLDWLEKNLGIADKDMKRLLIGKLKTSGLK